MGELSGEIYCDKCKGKFVEYVPDNVIYVWRYAMNHYGWGCKNKEFTCPECIKEHGGSE